MEARRKRVEDVAAVELAAGNEIERGDEEADPAGDEDGMWRGLIEGGDGGVPVGEECGSNRMVSGSPPKRIRDSGAPGGAGNAEDEADGDGERGRDKAGERTVDSHVHESVAAGDARADADDCAEGSAERGSGEHPRQSGAQAVRVAGRVVAEFVDEENAEQSERVGEAGGEESWVAKNPAPGPEIALAGDWRKTVKEVVHEPRAIHGCGDDAGEEKQHRQAIFSKRSSQRF